jgi:inosose dehydratase
MPDLANIDRRTFLAALGVGISGLKAGAIALTASNIDVGYAAITWGGNDAQAIDEIGEAGYKGIQLRASAFDRWGANPETLRGLLQKRGLTFAVLSSGNLKYDPTSVNEQLELHAKHARFVRDAGGLQIQVIDEKPQDRTPGLDDFKRLGEVMSALGRRTKAIGVPLVYHHHMNSTGEPPAAIEAIVAASDPDAVGLLFDIAHYQQGGGDPVAGIRKYAKRIRAVHLKDVRPIDAAPGYQWVELGRGRVDVKGCVAALKAANYDGWAIVELDRVVDPDGSPKASAVANRQYVEKQLGLRV